MPRWKVTGALVRAVLATLVAGCGGLADDEARPGTFLDETVEALLADVIALPAGDRPFARYLLLTQLDDSAATWDERALGERTPEATARAIERRLTRERIGASKLANSLSSEPRIARPESIADGHVLRIDIRDYGWDRWLQVAGTLHPDGWSAISAAAALGVELTGPDADRLKALTETAIPFLFAHDFVTTAVSGDLYYGLLDLPPTLAELQRQLDKGIADAPAGATSGYRAGFTTSAFSTNIRAVERRFSADNQALGYWQAFDFKDDERGSAVFSEPLSFEPDGTEVLFQLPNGLHGYYLANAAGQRLNESHLPTLTSSSRTADCFGCHDDGVLSFRDQVRTRFMASASAEGFSDADRASVLEVYPETGRLDRMRDSANERYAAALRQTGQEGALSEPVREIAVDFEDSNLVPELAAQELFVDPDQLGAVFPELSRTSPAEGPRQNRESYLEQYWDSLCQLQRQARNPPLGCR